MYSTLKAGKFHQKYFLQLASAFCPQIWTINVKSLTYLSFLNEGAVILTIIYLKGTCRSKQCNFANQINLDTWLFLYNLYFFDFLYYLFLYNFDEIFQYATLLSVLVEDVDGEGPEEILCFDIDLAIICSFELLELIAILMLTNCLNNKSLLITKGYFDRIFPLYCEGSHLSILLSFVYIRPYNSLIRLYLILQSKAQHETLTWAEFIAIIFQDFRNAGTFGFFSFFWFLVFSFPFNKIIIKQEIRFSHHFINCLCPILGNIIINLIIMRSQQTTSSMKKSNGGFKFFDKIKALFCAKPPLESEANLIVYRKEPQNKIMSPKKQPRQNLNIDDVFLKLSRKNIVQQQFYTNEVLNQQLERHIGTRIKGCLMAVVHGQFSEESTKTLKMSTWLVEKPMKTIPYRQQIKSSNLIRVRPNSIDLVLYQTQLTICPPKKPKMAINSHKNIQVLEVENLNQKQVGQQIDISQSLQLQKLINEQFKQILELIKCYDNRVENIVIVCSKYIDLLEKSKQLLGFSRNYLFELERVRQNQELVCNIVYLSKNANFLRLNEKSFKEYVIGEMQLTIQEQSKMQSILNTLIQYKYHRQIAYALRILKKQVFTTKSLFHPFLAKIQKENFHIKEIIDSMKNEVFKNQQLRETPELVMPTPLFNKVRDESKNLNIEYVVEEEHHN